MARRLPSPPMAVALLALCIALSGSAAADPVANGAASLTATVKKALGLAKKADRRSKRALALARKPGPTGPQGLPGGKGDTGAPGPTGSIQGAPAGGDLTGSYPNPLISPDAVSGDQVEDSSLTDSDIANDAIFPRHLLANSVGSSEIQSAAVETTELDVDAVTRAKIAEDAVGASQLAITLRESAGVIVPGGTGGNGDYETREQEVNCAGTSPVGVAIAGGGYWDAPSNTTELTITQLKLGLGFVTARGGNDSGTDRVFKAQAYCLEF
jgi:hypothetical protein